MATGAPVIGIMMLDCPQIDVPGCSQSDSTYRFAIKRRVVKGASVAQMTSGSRELLAPVLETARELEREGVDAIMGDCGFMALFQRELQAQASVPVFASSLLLVPLVAQLLPQGRRVGILTYRANTLSEAHFNGAGWSSEQIPVAVAGVDEQSAWRLFLTPGYPFQSEERERQLLMVSRRLVAQYPDLGALVLECTIMPPFARKLQAEIHLPIFDITMLASLVAQSLSRCAFEKQHRSCGIS
ncbi:MAG: hypothetical protein HY725_06275 [Candidatus Rokubacteria bacterium]|nr:hypothetical protein [Candidatus Rokubacteria bacterium]